MFTVDSDSPKPHCAKCGAYLDKAPDNAFGWCGACQTWAQMGGLQPAPRPLPALPVGPWLPQRLEVTCAGRMSPNPSWSATQMFHGSLPTPDGVYIGQHN